jgi:hypothetical protein
VKTAVRAEAPAAPVAASVVGPAAVLAAVPVVVSAAEQVAAPVAELEEAPGAVPAAGLCDPSSPSKVCSPTNVACCDTTSLGRLAQFTLPENAQEPTFKVVAIYAGEEILGLASTASGDVLVATKTSTGGALHSFSPGRSTSTTLATFTAPAYSAIERRNNGEIYVELLGTPKIQRLTRDGGVLALDAGLVENPNGIGRLQNGPDGQLYRLIGAANSNATLEVYSVP